MFVLELSPSYHYPVKFDLPTDQGPKPVEFMAYFDRLAQHEVDELVGQTRSGAVNDQELVHRVLRGWDGVQQADGQPLAYGPEGLDTLLNIVPVRPAIVMAWFNSLKHDPSVKN